MTWLIQGLLLAEVNGGIKDEKERLEAALNQRHTGLNLHGNDSTHGTLSVAYNRFKTTSFPFSEVKHGMVSLA